MKQVGYSPSQTLRVRSREMPTCTGHPKRSECVAVADSATFSPGWSARPLASACAVKVIAMAVAPRHPVVGQVLFFVAIVVPFTIFLTVLMVPRLGSLREITVAILGLYPTVVYRMSSPLVLAGYDEHQHAQSLMNLLHGSGLFSPNPVLRVSPYYPGLELFTGVGIRLTGLPVVLAMSLVVLLCRLLLVLIIYHSALLVSPSRRGASLVVAFYAVSSEFYSFNSAFAYQTLALTLGLGGIFLLRRAQLADYAAARRLFFIASLVLIATVVTHHATSWMVLAFLIAWAAVSRKGERKLLARAAVVMGAAVAIWTRSPRYAPGSVLCANLFERCCRRAKLF